MDLETREAWTARLFGNFAWVFLVFEVLSKAAFSVLQGAHLTPTIIGIIFTGLSALSVVLLTNTRPLNLFERSMSDGERGPCSKLFAAARLWADARIWLLSPTNLAFGFCAAYMNGYVNAKLVKQELGGVYVASFGALTAVVAAAASPVLSRIATRVSKAACISIGAICTMAIPISLASGVHCLDDDVCESGWGWWLTILYCCEQAKKMATTAGWFSLWGDPVKHCITNNKKDTLWNGKAGGLGTLSKTPISNMYDSNNEIHRLLRETGKWQFLRLHLRGCNVYVMNYYGYTGAGYGGFTDRHTSAKSERAIGYMLSLAASLGDVPVIIGGDFNVTVRQSFQILRALATGRWFDAGAIMNDTGHTYSKNNDYDAVINGSRIDLALLNGPAKQALRSYSRIRGTTIKGGHLPIELEFDWDAIQLQGHRLWRPRPFPVSDVNMDVKNNNHLADKHVEAMKTHFYEALEEGNIDVAWEQLNEVMENYLTDYCAGVPKPYDRGRGQPPHWVSFKVAADNSEPKMGATTLRARRLLRLERQVENYFEHRRRLERWHKEGRVPHLDDLAQLEAEWSKIAKTASGTLEHMLGWRPGHHPTMEKLDIIAHTIREHRLDDIRFTQQSRISAWRKDMQRSYLKDKKRVHNWIKDGRMADRACVIKKGNGALVEVEAMFQELEGFWKPLYNQYVEQPEPDWESFLDKFGYAIPTIEEVKLQPITSLRWMEHIKQLKPGAGRGTDSWRCNELKALPRSIWDLISDYFMAIEKHKKWAVGQQYAGISLSPKKDNPDCTQFRPITLYGILYRTYTSLRHQDLEKWRESWMPRTLRGARRGATVHDITWATSLHIEKAHATGQQLLGIAYDRKKCFDNMLYDMGNKLSKQMGVQEDIADTMLVLQKKLKRFLMLGIFTSQPWLSTNGPAQGCCWSVTQILLLMTVWSNAITLKLPRCLPFTYYDDSSILADDWEEYKQAHTLTLQFDELSGQKLHEDKSVAFAVNPTELVDFNIITIAGQPIKVVDGLKLLGAWLQVNGVYDTTELDDRWARAGKDATRIRWLPLGWTARASMADIYCYSTGSFGAEHGQPSSTMVTKFVKGMKNMFWKHETTWPNLAHTFSFLVKGHKLHPVTAGIYQALRVAASQVSSSFYDQALLREVYEAHKANPSRKPTGVMGQLVNAAKQLRLNWDSLYIFKNEYATIDLRDKSGASEHYIRDAIRAFHIYNGPVRNDNDGAARIGVDYYATRLQLNKWEKNITDWDMAKKAGCLRWALGGAIHTEERLNRCGYRETDICKFCELRRPEDAYHIFHVCPAWQNRRTRLHALTTPAERAAWPGVTAHNGVIPHNKELEEWRQTHILREDYDEQPPERQPEDEEWSHEGFIRVATDGSCLNQMHRPIAAAGCSAFFGYGHSHNSSFPLPGVIQDSARAEARAVARVCAWAWAPTEIMVDNAASVKSLQRILRGHDINGLANRDIWERVEIAVRAKGLEFFKVLKVAAHGRDSEQDQKITDFNEQADILAREAASAIAPPEALLKTMRRTYKVAQVLHETMAEIFADRIVGEHTRRAEQESLEAAAAALEALNNFDDMDPLGHFQYDTAEVPVQEAQQQPQDQVVIEGGTQDNAAILIFKGKYPDYKWPPPDDSGYANYVSIELPEIKNWDWTMGWKSYSKEAYYAIQWYYRQIKWNRDTEDMGISWLELAIDFVLTTAITFQSQRRGNDITTAKQYAWVFSQMTRLIEKIIKKRVTLHPPVPSGYPVEALTPMGYARTQGFSNHAKLIYPAKVGEILARQAGDMTLKFSTHSKQSVGTYEWKLELPHDVPAPLWQPPAHLCLTTATIASTDQYYKAALDRWAAAANLPNANRQCGPKGRMKVPAGLAMHPLDKHHLDNLPADTQEEHKKLHEMVADRNIGNEFKKTHDYTFEPPKFRCRICDWAKDNTHPMRTYIRNKDSFCKRWDDIRRAHAAAHG
eukprot:TRINITY_DN12951_c0_g1_i13.p1 TRINITY_DN12951_c0_g1~~TRINITY_DN12951_c0_g1_i13.p1  ORF type:complete len:2127 (+),score=337.51 TRINITY_DN12951_c0_g1_i13:514-6381(+)